MEALESFVLLLLQFSEPGLQIFPLLLSLSLLFVVLVRHSAQVDHFCFAFLLQFLPLLLLEVLCLLLIHSFYLVLHESALYVVLDVCLFPLQSLEFFLHCFLLLNIILGCYRLLPHMYDLLSFLLISLMILESFEVIKTGSLLNKTKALPVPGSSCSVIVFDLGFQLPLICVVNFSPVF